MQSLPAQPAPLWPLVLYFAAVVVLVSGILGLSYLLGQRQKHKPDEEPYESGMLPTGTTPFHFDVLFYLNAMFFVVFDLETMFIITWAIAFRDVGWVGYVEILLFIVVMLAVLTYLWRSGALDWRTYREKMLQVVVKTNAGIPKGKIPS
ncbi:MAG TPA: NADH-quinone oxidoreductase subunit A [Anaerolineaceae bacterium]|jgi:NADH-quinone oxidoreductase subunit A